MQRSFGILKILPCIALDSPHCSQRVSAGAALISRKFELAKEGNAASALNDLVAI